MTNQALLHQLIHENCNDFTLSMNAERLQLELDDGTEITVEGEDVELLRELVSNLIRYGLARSKHLREVIEDILYRLEQIDSDHAEQIELLIEDIKSGTL